MKINTGRRTAVIAFLIALAIRVILNGLIPVMRSIPDEMGAVALAAKMVGYDWSYVLSHPQNYYGSGNTLFVLPFFVFIKNPVILYQCLLGVSAFLYSSAAYIACRILQKYYTVDKTPIFLILVSVSCSFFTPGRSSHIDNEPMLVLMWWLIIYLLIMLQFTDEKSKKIAPTLCMVGAIGLSLITHTRAILYGVLVFIIVGIYYILNKKWLVHIKVFITSAIAIFSLSIGFKGKLQEILFVQDATGVINNTPSALGGEIINGGGKILSPVGIRSFFDLVLSNLWVSFIFGMGILIFCFFLILQNTYMAIKKRDCSAIEKDIFFPMLCCVLGIAISILGLGVSKIDHALRVQIEQTNLSRMHFYLRYYGNYFGPLFLFFTVYLSRKREKNNFSLTFATIISIYVAVIYSVVSYLGMTTIRYRYELDWFYYFAPFSGMLNSWPNTIQSLSYFAAPTLFVTIVFGGVVYLFFVNKKRTALCILFSCLIWQYVYGVIKFDAPYASGEHYYLSVNSMTPFFHDNNDLFKQYEMIYYLNEVYGPAYNVQFFLPTYKIIIHEDKIDYDNFNIIISNLSIEPSKIPSEYFLLELDENEFLYFNEIRIYTELKQRGYLPLRVGE